jgi:hypothetical protein
MSGRSLAIAMIDQNGTAYGWRAECYALSPPWQDSALQLSMQTYTVRVVASSGGQRKRETFELPYLSPNFNGFVTNKK